MSIQLGSYVTYKNVTWLVTEINNGFIRIINSSETKRRVKISSVIKTNYRPAIVIEGYIVTRLGTIISRTSHRVMKWDKFNTQRIEILREAGLS